MIGKDKPIEFAELQVREPQLHLKLRPESIPLAILLKADTPEGLKRMMKSDEDLMKTYKLSEGNLCSLRLICKFFFVIGRD